MRYFNLLMFVFATNANANNNKVIYTDIPISVSIQHSKDTCSILELSYFVNKIDTPVYIAKGTTGIEANDFIFSVLTLHGNKTKAMHLGNVQSKSWYDPNEYKRELKLTLEGSPYKSKLDLKKWFPKTKGTYYIHYSFSYEPDKVGDLKMKGGVSKEVYIQDVIESQRYYIEIDDTGCVVEFFDGIEDFEGAS
jgi:hypothetical protein